MSSEIAANGTAGLLKRPEEETRPQRRHGAAPLLFDRIPALLGAWDDLSSHPLHPVPHASATWLGGMLSELSTDARRGVLLVARDAEGDLAGIAAMRRDGLVRNPFPVLRSWAPPMMYSGAPLIDRRAPEATLRSLLGAARRHCGARAMIFHRVEMASPLHAAFLATAQHHGFAFVGLDRRECAALDATADYETWFEASFPRKRRKEFRRLRTRLSEAGRLESASWTEEQSLDIWVEQFLELERSGWKGHRGTAIGCSEESARFLSMALRRLAQRGDLLFWRLSLDDKPVAMLFGMAGLDRASLIKIAYDEAFARFSPGVLVTLDATAELMRRPDVQLVDSCAVPNHPMIDHLWRERLAFEDIVIATPGTSPATFAAIVAVERARRRAREAAKQLYHRYLSWKGVPR